MVGNRIFIMLKLDVIENKYIGKIIDMIIQVGFEIKVMKYMKLIEEQVKKFYEVYVECLFYGELVEYMFLGFIVVVILEKDNVVEDFCKLIGVIDFVEVVEGMICKYYVELKGCNVVYGLDFDENVEIEGKFYFVVNEIF